MRPLPKRDRRRGNTVIEAAIFIPILLTLLVATEQLGKLTYTYYSLKKALYSAARYVGTQQGVNFCDASDPNIVAAENLAATGTTDGSALPLVQDFTADMITITAESYIPAGQTQSLGACPCQDYGDGVPACQGPNFISVTVPNGYNFTPNIPFSPVITIPLTPQVLIPYGGT
jgi:Flp pilus assembly protein TadG